MPAKDATHDTVIQALKKRGWLIRSEQVALILPERRVWVDLHVQHSTNGNEALIEVKSFDYVPSPVETFSSIIGKYMYYRASMEYLQLEYALFLAIPTLAYNGVFAEAISKRLIDQLGIRLLVFDREREVITQWT